MDVPKPSLKDNEVLVKVHATPVTSGDWRIQSLNLPRGFQFLMRMIYGFSKPRQLILGTQLAGTIEAVGKRVSKFKVGDAVIAENALGLGTHAQYKCLSETGSIALKPEALSFEEAAVLGFGGVTALGYLKAKATLRPGEKLLVHGASGAVGIAAVQLGKHFGASVTAVCSAPNFEFVKTYGAEHVIDYRKEDFTKNGIRYDVILDAVGTLSRMKCKNSLSEGGRLLLVSADPFEQLEAPLGNLFSSAKVISGVVNFTPQLMGELSDLVETGKFRAVIDRQFTLDEIGLAYAYTGQRHKRGNVVVRIDP